MQNLCRLARGDVCRVLDAEGAAELLCAVPLGRRDGVLLRGRRVLLDLRGPVARALPLGMDHLVTVAHDHYVRRARLDWGWVVALAGGLRFAD